MSLREFLQTLPAFQEFPADELDVLEQSMHQSEFPDGHRFTEQGRRSQEMFLIIEGDVSVVRRDEITGQEHELKLMHSGELFGVLSLLDHQPASATCVARGPVKAAALPRAAYELLFMTAAPIAFHFQFLIANQLARDLTDRNKSLRARLREG